jgi:hypothetical protein
MTIIINLLTYIFEALISLFFFGKKFEKRFHIGIILLAFSLSALIQFGRLCQEKCVRFLKVHKSMHFQPRWISPRLEKAEVKSCARISQYGL